MSRKSALRTIKIRALRGSKNSVLMCSKEGRFIKKLLFLFGLMLLVLPANSKAERLESTGGGIVCDYVTGLEWVTGRLGLDWFETESWISRLGGEWRFPTYSELLGVFETGEFYPGCGYPMHLPNPEEEPLKIWTNEREGNSARHVEFSYWDGYGDWDLFDLWNNCFLGEGSEAWHYGLSPWHLSFLAVAVRNVE